MISHLVECCLKTLSTVRYDLIRTSIEQFLREFKTSVPCHSEITDYRDVEILRENVEYLRIDDVFGE